MFLGTFGLQANLVRTGRHPPTHPPTRAPPTHPPTHPGATHPGATHPPTHPPGRQECFWAIWSEQPECQKRIFLGTCGLQPNLVRTAGMPKTKVFGHIRASGQFGPNRAQPTHPATHPPGRHLPGRHPPTHPPTWAPRMFLGTFQLQANLVQTGRHAPTHPATHPGATHPGATHPRTQPPGRHECFWAHSGFSPIWSEQPECQKRIFLGTFGLQPNLVRTAGMPKTNLFGHIRASAQGGPNSRNAEKECFWAHSGFRPIWSEPGATHPPTHPPGRHPPTHPPTRAPPTHPPTHPGATNVFGHVPASAQFGPNSRNAKNESFWAHSGFGPIWSEQPECQKRIFLGTFGLQPGLVRTAGMPKRNVLGHIRASGQFGPNRAPPTHPPTHPPTRAPPTHPPTHPSATHPPTHPPGRHPPTHPPARAPRMFLGTFRLQPNVVRTAGMSKTNLFGHIRASAQFGPNSRNAENECFLGTFGLQANLVRTGRHPPTHPPTRAPPTHRPTNPPGRHECFWAHSGFSPIWSEQPECQKRIFLGTFRLQPNLVRTAGMPKTNLFGHIGASAQFGPNSRNAENECFWVHSGFRPRWSEPGATHPPTHPPGRHESFWAHSGFSPIWSEQPECQKRIFLGTFGLQPNLVRIAGTPKTNLFGHIRASAQLGPNSRNAENECFWAHSGFRPIWSEPGATHPPTHPPSRAPPTRAPPTHPPTHPPTRAPRKFLGTFRLQPNLVRTAGMPKTNLFGHIRAPAQFGPNSRNAKNESFWAHSGFSPIWSE